MLSKNGKHNFYQVNMYSAKRLYSINNPRIYSNADTSKFDIIKENKKKSGIYRRINNKNGKTYIGSSVNLSNLARCFVNSPLIICVIT